jgi:hypothetical protein
MLFRFRVTEGRTVDVQSLLSLYGQVFITAHWVFDQTRYLMAGGEDLV